MKSLLLSGLLATGFLVPSLALAASTVRYDFKLTLDTGEVESMALIALDNQPATISSSTGDDDKFVVHTDPHVVDAGTSDGKIQSKIQSKIDFDYNRHGLHATDRFNVQTKSGEWFGVTQTSGSRIIKFEARATLP